MKEESPAAVRPEPDGSGTVHVRTTTLVAWNPRLPTGVLSRPMKDVIVTVVAGIVLATAFMLALFSCAASGWGDRPIEGSVQRPTIHSTALARNG